MKAEEIKTKTVDELRKLLLEARKEQFNMRFQKINGTLENTADIRKTRRTVARIKTFLNAKLREEKSGSRKTGKATAPAKKKTQSKAKGKAA